MTDRTLAVGEAFGIGVDEEQRFPVFQDFRVEVNPGHIVYVTGESGGGKSVLLRELRNAMEALPEFGTVATDWELPIDGDEVLVNGVGSTVTEALETLSLAGLNDAFLWLRSFRELSDGQKYRYRIAKLLASKASTWLFDEFTATLDRETARIVAFSLQKTARRLQRTVVAATTHTDLAEDLAPTVHVHKGFMDAAHVSYAPTATVNECSVAKDMFIRPGTRRDHDALKQFHYRNNRSPFILRIYTLCLRHPENIAGVIVYSPSPFFCAGRRLYLNRIPTNDEVRRDWAIISRVIVHPRYRNIGLGTKLVRETLGRVCKDLNVQYVEAIAVMARYNPFFRKAGMTEVRCDSTFRQRCRKILEKLQPYGFQPMLTSSTDYCLETYRALSPEQQETVRSMLLSQRRALLGERYAHNLPSKTELADNLKNPELVATAIRRAAIGGQNKNYYVWHQDRTG